MEAVVLHEPGRLMIDTLPDAEPGPGEVRVRITNGGICGSDLHYFHHGGFGVVRMRAPMVLGHEIAGKVDALGPGVSGLALGDKVAVDPSRPCGECAFCRSGATRHCADMRFMGSAMRDPHVDGGFREHVVCDVARAAPVGAATDGSEAAFAEPLAVCLHAANRAGDLDGRRVLVSGMGPIGCLTLLAARHGGASHIVAADISDPALAVASRIGADRAVNVGRPGALAEYEAGKGAFDVVFECSGHPDSLRAALAVTRPQGTIVQVGNFPGEVTLPANMLVAKEIALKGSFRFDIEFRQAADLISRHAIDVRPLLTDTLPFRQAAEAFALASDRSRAMKVQLGF